MPAGVASVASLRDGRGAVDPCGVPTSTGVATRRIPNSANRRRRMTRDSGAGCDAAARSFAGSVSVVRAKHEQTANRTAAVSCWLGQDGAANDRNPPLAQHYFGGARKRWLRSALPSPLTRQLCGSLAGSDGRGLIGEREARPTAAAHLTWKDRLLAHMLAQKYFALHKPCNCNKLRSFFGSLLPRHCGAAHCGANRAKNFLMACSR